MQPTNKFVKTVLIVGLSCRQRAGRMPRVRCADSSAAGTRRPNGPQPPAWLGPGGFLRGVVTEVDGAAAEPVLLRQRQVQADLVGQGPGAAAHDGRDDEQLVFVYPPGRDGLGGQVRAADGEVTAGR